MHSSIQSVFMCMQHNIMLSCYHARKYRLYKCAKMQKDDSDQNFKRQSKKGSQRSSVCRHHRTCLRARFAVCYSNVILKRYWLVLCIHATVLAWYSKCGEAKKCEFIHAIKVKLSIHTYVSPPSRMSDMDTADAGVRHRAPHHSRSPTCSHSPSNSRSPCRQRSSTPKISRSATESPAPRRPWRRRWRNWRRRRGQGQVYTCSPGH